jgi:hypothetical protein
MPTYDFKLILDGSEATEEMAEALYGAGCDDALLGSSCGVITLDFAREAPSLREAIATALADVRRADPGLKVVRIEPDELVTAAEVARRIKQSRESVRLYATGQRGPGHFPPPVTQATQKTPLYRWADVANWVTKDLVELGKVGTFRQAIESPSPEESRLIGALNAALELDRYVSDDKEADEIITIIRTNKPDGTTQVERLTRDDLSARQKSGVRPHKSKKPRSSS